MPHKRRNTKGLSECLSKTSCKELSLTDRAFAVALHDVAGWTESDVAKHMECVPSTIHRAIKQVKEASKETRQPLQDISNYQRDTRTGRPHAVTKQQGDELCQYVVSSKNKRDKTALQHITELSLSISESTFKQLMYD